MRSVPAASPLPLMYLLLAGVLAADGAIVTKTAMTRVSYEDAEMDQKRRATVPWGTWGEPAEVAKGAVFLASDDASWVTGIGLPVDGGFLAR